MQWNQVSFCFANKLQGSGWFIINIYKNIFSVREICGKVTLKHIYEIAKIKAQDPPLEWKPLKEICVMLIATARTCGIEVVKELDAKVNVTIYFIKN